MTDRPKDTTLDLFLGGKLRIFQPSEGYRAGIDPVLLAASLPVKPGERSGIGMWGRCRSLCLMRRTREVEVKGVKLMPLWRIWRGAMLEKWIGL